MCCKCSMLVYCCIFLLSVHAVAEEIGEAENSTHDIRPWPELYDEWLGESKNIVGDLIIYLHDYSSSRDEDRFRAWLSIKRLEELPTDKAEPALPTLVYLIGESYKPYMIPRWNPRIALLRLQKSQEKEYPADSAVVEFGEVSTPYVVDHIKYMHYDIIAGQDDPEILRDRIASLVDVLDAIEESGNAEKLLFAKLDSCSPKLVRSQKHLKMAIALVRVRKGLKMHAETPIEEYEQELQRVREETGLEEEAGDYIPPGADTNEEHLPLEVTPSDSEPSLIPPDREQSEISPAGETPPKEKSPIPPSSPGWLVSNGHWVVISVIALTAIVIAGVLIKKKR